VFRRWRLKRLIARLSDSRPLVRQRAVEALSQWKSADSLAPLAAALEDPDSRVVEAATRALAALGPAAVDALRPFAIYKASAGYEEPVRRSAIRLLIEIPGAEATDLLAEALTSGGPSSEEAGWELARRGDPRAVPFLVRYLRMPGESDAREKRLAAAQALGRLQDPRAIEPLREAVASVDAWIGMPAAQALRDFGYQPASELERAVWDLLFTEPGELQQEDAKKLASGLGEFERDSPDGSEKRMARMRTLAPAAASTLHKDPGVRAKAVALLQYARQPVAADLLRTCLEDAEPAVVVAAITALAARSDVPVDRFSAALGAESVLVRRTAVAALSRSTDPEVLERMAECLRDTDRSVRLEAIRYLARSLDSRAVDGLIFALRDPDSEIRAEAAAGLRESSDPRIVPTMIKWLEDDDEKVRASAVDLLRRSADPRAAEPLLAALERSHDRERIEVVLALAELRYACAVDLIMEALPDAHRFQVGARLLHVEGLVEALGRTGNIRAIGPLVGLLGHGSYDVRKQAGAALSRILEHNSADVREQQLQELAGLTYVAIERQEEICTGIYHRWTDGVDVSQVRQLARQELVRRGLGA
jgi:HEAT repeat protein